MQRAEKRFPLNFSKELVDAMETKFGTDRVIDSENITNDTSYNTYTSREKNSILNENSAMDEFDTMNEACQGSVHTDNESEKGYSGKKRKVTLKTTDMKDTILQNNKLVVSTLQLAEEGHMKRHEKYYALMERRLSRKEENAKKLIKLEEQKVKVQMSLVAALNSIAQAMLKISESFSNKK